MSDQVRETACLVLMDRERLETRIIALRVVHEPHRGHIRLYDVDFLQRGDDQQLEAEPAEQLECEPGRLVGTAAGATTNLGAFKRRVSALARGVEGLQPSQRSTRA